MAAKVGIMAVADVVGVRALPDDGAMSGIHECFKIPSTLVITMLLLQVGCQANVDQRAGDTSVAFSFVNPEVASKSSGVFKALDDAGGVIVTIYSESGEEVYSSAAIELFRFGDGHVSQPLSLVPGTYFLREFIVIDDSGDALYATPTDGSPMAHLVSDPLDIEFSVSPDVVTTVRPEVISAEGAVPEDFGYASFGLDDDAIVDVIDFLVSVFVYDEALAALELATADIAITNDSGDSLYTGSLAARTNPVTVRDGYANYHVTIVKSGYEDYSVTFTASELAGFFQSTMHGPLEVVLVEAPEPDSMVLWNRLGSDAEMAGEVGVPALVSGPIHFGAMAHGSGVALADGDAQIRFDNPFGADFPESGALEFWWRPVHDENTSTGSHYSERVVFIMTNDEWNGTWPTVRFQMTYRGHGWGADRTFVQIHAPSGNQATLYYDLNFSAAQLMHVGIAWDASDPSSPLRLYVDGALQAPAFEYSIEPASSISEIAAYLAAGHSHDLELHRAAKRRDGAANQFDSEQFVDNLKIWSHAKDDFSDRHHE